MQVTVIAVFATIGLVMLVFGAYEYYMQRRLMANAQQVQATITESNLARWRRALCSDRCEVLE